jgi:uncharacterized membrane protein
VTSASAPTIAATRPRRGYIDWLRGLAVVIMIEAHTIDSWTEMPWRGTLIFWYHQLLAGWAAPIFLFCAGLSVALASGGKLRRALASPADAASTLTAFAPAPGSAPISTGASTGAGASTRANTSATAASRNAGFDAAKSMMWRGLQIWGLALLFRVQAWLLSPGATVYGILKVDILNVMGPAICGAALVWGLASRSTSRPIARIAALSAAAAVFSLLTPLVRASTTLAMLPDPIEWYFRPWPGRTTFTFFPWAGFVFAGAAAGSILDAVRDARNEVSVNLKLGLAGLAIAAASLAGSFLPSIYPQSAFWTSSPSFFFLRIGILLMLMTLACLWEQRSTAERRSTGSPTRGLRALGWSPLKQFGRTSLFVYWIHVEMVYGILSYPLHRNLSLPAAVVAFALFTLAMFGLSVLKTRLADRVSPGAKPGLTPAVTTAP